MALIPKGFDCVLPEKNEEDDRKIQKIAMQVLQDERELRFAPIVLPPGRLAHSAARWIGEKCPIVSLAIVIAGHAEPQRESQDQQCWGPLPEMMVSVNQGRIERGKIRGRLKVV